MKKLLLVILFLSVEILSARGYLVPKDQSYNPFLIKSHRVEVTIKNGAAKTKIKEVFINPHSTDMEGIFVFPLPKGSSVSLFRMKMKGKWVKGRVLEKNKARGIYNRIVRQMKDPGLIEYMGNDMFKASVYPIPKNGLMEVEITYTQAINVSGNIFAYVYPLKGKSRLNTQRVYHYCGRYYRHWDRRYISTGCTTNYESKQPISTKEDFTFTAKIESSIPIKSVYSPTYKMDIIKREKKATIGFEKNKVKLDKDIKIFYTVSKKDIGASILAYHPKEAKNGYFMMMVSPKSKIDNKEIENKNLLLVVDTSGSMSGEKMKYAKKALKYVVNRLNKNDKFNIIRFSSGVDYFKDSSVFATEENVKKALEYVDDLYASGGTAIDDAMREALKQLDDKLTNLIIFITDGRPTVGETEKKVIVRNIVKNNKKAKIFSFGIGEDLNALLLDEISNKNHGSSEYMKEGTEIETKISSFYDKVAFPVLTNLKLKINGVKTYDLFPYSLPDLFKGQQLSLFGRYKIKKGDKSSKSFWNLLYKSGKTATLVLTGDKKGKRRTYEFNVSFKSYETNDFIPHIWATKKVGFLLESIRTNGHNNELVEEVKKLATKFGIVTPYTSYLVTEPVKKVREQRLDENIGRRDVSRSLRKGSSRGFGRIGTGAGGGGSGYMVDDMDSEKEETISLSDTASGSVAVRTSKKLNKMKSKDRMSSSRIKKTVAGKVFVLRGGVWTDTYMDGKKAKPTYVKLKYMSDKYMKLISKNKTLRKYLSVGENVTVFYGRYQIEIRSNYSGSEILPKALLK